MSRMRVQPLSSRWLAAIAALGPLMKTALANDVLKTTGFTTCLDNSQIKVNKLDVQFDRSTQKITFDVGGESAKMQNVTAALHVTAYGKQVYEKKFNPCDDATKVLELCPCTYSNLGCSLAS